MSNEEKLAGATTIATHDGPFHADDVLGVAILSALHRPSHIIRTRDPVRLETADFAVDVGGIWDPTRGRFDHHQRSFDGRRTLKLDESDPHSSSGVAYASAGLVWQHHGAAYVRGVAHAMGFAAPDDAIERVVAEVDESLVQYIDLVDNGNRDVAPGNFGISALLGSLNATWLEERGADQASRDERRLGRFLDAVGIACAFLDAITRRALGRPLAATIVRASERRLGGRLLQLPEGGIPWKPTVVVEMSEVLLVTYPSGPGGPHLVQTVPIDANATASRHDLPCEWAGLGGDELARVSGVADATFCHPNRFIAGAKSVHGALRLAQLALGSKLGASSS